MAVKRRIERLEQRIGGASRPMPKTVLIVEPQPGETEDEATARVKAEQGITVDDDECFFVFIVQSTGAQSAGA